MVALLLAAQPNEWGYVAFAYTVVIGVLVLYVAWIVRRGRKVGQQLPPGERRWM